MVYHALVHYPEIKTEKIEAFRKKYDPTYNLIRAHITILFPIPPKISKKSLSEHIQEALTNWEPFKIEIEGFTKSWDHWLFLILREGNENIINLHDDLYMGILIPFLRKDIEYIPHVGLGQFIKESEKYSLKNPTDVIFDENKYKVALAEARSLNLSYETTVDKLVLVEISDEFTSTRNLEEFLLG